jgi:THAP4-like, heme-binding beta-barrel domain
MEMEGSGAAPALSSPPPVSELPLHPAIAPLKFLLGRWRGQGEGGFPTINSFRYGEELFFSHSGKARLSFPLALLFFSLPSTYLVLFSFSFDDSQLIFLIWHLISKYTTDL